MEKEYVLRIRYSTVDGIREIEEEEYVFRPYFEYGNLDLTAYWDDETLEMMYQFPTLGDA
jgi:hypothetical protein|tara:strand:- start:467 stop:646 length:180 start_codon:yes stop_codon:yes gene_type:complete